MQTNQTPPGPLAEALLEIVREAHFEGVCDFGPYEDCCPGATYCPPVAPRTKYMPNLDLAVIRLDEAGRAVEAANVLLSRDYPTGLIVPIGRNFEALGVRFRRWDIERWDAGTFSLETGQPLTSKGWTDNPPLTSEDDIVPGQANVDHPYQFMSPYPASNFKLLIAFWFMRLADRGVLNLDQPYNYRPTEGELAGHSEIRSLRDWLDPMITYSDNYATQALLKQLWDIGQAEAMNTEFGGLGLQTLQINGTNPATGYRWQPGQFHMTALDTARLLWLIEGGPDDLWTGRDGRPVTADFLSDRSRQYLKGLLAEQGLNECLSTSNLYGGADVRPGIPAGVPPRWVNPADGTVKTGELYYGVDVRPGNRQAEVSFAHKTGLTYNYASDSGIVRSLPGQPFRHYIIAFFANLGYRYTDPVFAARPDLPYRDKVLPICYSQKIPALGRRIDDWLKKADQICL